MVTRGLGLVSLQGWRARSVLMVAVCFSVHCTETSAEPQSSPAGTESMPAAPAPVQGQSGSEASGGGEGRDVVACPCGGALYAAALRVTVLTRALGPLSGSTLPWCEAGSAGAASNGLTGSGGPPLCSRVRLHVEEVLKSRDLGVAAGDELELASDGYLPCFVGTDQVLDGEEALAVVALPRTDCEARQACLETCARSASQPEADCRASCGDEPSDGCPPPAPVSKQRLEAQGSVRLTKWGDALLFAQTNQAQLNVPLSEFDAVWSGTNGCSERFNWVDLPGAFPPGHSAP